MARCGSTHWLRISAPDVPLRAGEGSARSKDGGMEDLWI